MPLPNFFVIGAAKAASTSLHRYLGQHPEIFVSPRKEPNYFAFRSGGVPRYRGPDAADPRAYRGLEHRLRVAKYAESITEERPYRALFDGAGEARAVGEASVSYLYFPEAAAAICEELPESRLIAVLRNPADRAFSKFVQFRREGLEPLAAFGDALDAEDDRVRDGWSPTWHYERRGLYHRQLSSFAERFPREQLLVLLYDELRADPKATLQRVFRFLRVRDDFVPDLAMRHNASERIVRRPRSRTLHRWLGGERVLERWSTRPRRHALGARLRRAAVRANVRRERWSHPPMSPADRARIVDEVRQDVTELARWLGRDLSHWLR